MCRSFAVGLIFFISLCGAEGADRIKIEIAEATNITQMLHTSTGLVPHFLFSAKAILPDGSHARLSCISGDNGCAGIEPMAAEKSSLNSNT